MSAMAMFRQLFAHRPHGREMYCTFDESPNEDVRLHLSVRAPHRDVISNTIKLLMQSGEVALAVNLPRIEAYDDLVRGELKYSMSASISAPRYRYPNVRRGTFSGVQRL